MYHLVSAPVLVENFLLYENVLLDLSVHRLPSQIQFGKHWNIKIFSIISSGDLVHTLSRIDDDVNGTFGSRFDGISSTAGTSVSPESSSNYWYVTSFPSTHLLSIKMFHVIKICFQ